MCLGFFFLLQRCCVFFLSSCWGWRRLLLSLLLCVCSACPGAPAVFPLRVMQLAALLGFHTWLTQVGCPTPAVMVSRGVGVVLVQMSCYPLCFFLVLAQLPLRGSAPLTGELVSLTPVCWSTPGVGLEDSLLRHLVCSHVPSSSAAFPAAGYLRVFRSPGVCTSASLVTWVGLQPFPSFSGLLLLRLLARVVGVLHPVSGCSSCGVVCLVCRCGHPAALPLP